MCPYVKFLKKKIKMQKILRIPLPARGGLELTNCPVWLLLSLPQLPPPCLSLFVTRQFVRFPSEIMGLLSIIRKIKRKEKEMRILMV
jgi:hypothetical protein